MAGLEELKLDLDEYRTLYSQATRPKVKDVLNINIRKLETDILLKEDSEEKVENGKGDSLLSARSKTESRTKTYTVAITTYAWDQSDKFMKIYVTANGVQSIPNESVTCEFFNSSFKLKINELNGKNYELHVAHLMNDIIPESCYHKIKADMVLVMLKKQEEKKTWAHVTKQERDIKDKKKKEPKFDGGKDPNEGLMDLMKQMYDDGDDDMKRTIQKAWVESRNKSEMGMM